MTILYGGTLCTGTKVKPEKT